MSSSATSSNAFGTGGAASSIATVPSKEAVRRVFKRALVTDSDSETDVEAPPKKTKTSNEPPKKTTALPAAEESVPFVDAGEVPSGGDYTDPRPYLESIGVTASNVAFIMRQVPITERYGGGRGHRWMISPEGLARLKRWKETGKIDHMLGIIKGTRLIFDSSPEKPRASKPVVVPAPPPIALPPPIVSAPPVPVVTPRPVPLVPATPAPAPREPLSVGPRPFKSRDNIRAFLGYVSADLYRFTNFLDNNPTPAIPDWRIFEMHDTTRRILGALPMVTKVIKGGDEWLAHYRRHRESTFNTFPNLESPKEPVFTSIASANPMPTPH